MINQPHAIRIQGTFNSFIKWVHCFASSVFMKTNRGPTREASSLKCGQLCRKYSSCSKSMREGAHIGQSRRSQDSSHSLAGPATAELVHHTNSRLLKPIGVEPLKHGAQRRWTGFPGPLTASWWRAHALKLLSNQPFELHLLQGSEAPKATILLPC